MQVYWSLKQIPELAGLSRRDRWRVFNGCGRKHHAFNARITHQNVIAYVLVFLVPFSGVVVSSLLHFENYSDLLCTFPLATGTMVGWFIYSRLQMNRLRPYYSEFVRKELQKSQSH